MKLTTVILAVAMTAGGSGATQAVAQNPDAIDNARSIAKSLQQKQAIDTNAALDAAGVGQTAKPAPGAPAPAVKPAVIPGSQSASHPKQVSVASAPAAKPAPASQHNRLQHVNVVPGTDSIRIEMSASSALTPKVSKLSSPARILVELPETVAATPQNHIAIGNGGVKGVRIGTDGRTPPTTSVVVDLEKASAFDLTPGPADTLVLTVHTQAAMAASGAKPAPRAPKAIPVAMSTTPAAKATPTSAKPVAAAKTAPAAKTVVVARSVLAKPEPAANTKPATPVAEAPKPQPKPEEKHWAMNGKRDPFFSPVVQQPTGSGCANGKKCLEIGNINVRGVVKSDTGFIAVVTNNLNKAYFLRENDPVFNGYVVKITGDSVVFQETVEDKLGKPFTREVVKRIFTPAV
jgi:Tfp pilus assembly protein PilP